MQGISGRAHQGCGLKLFHLEYATLGGEPAPRDDLTANLLTGVVPRPERYEDPVGERDEDAILRAKALGPQDRRPTLAPPFPISPRVCLSDRLTRRAGGLMVGGDLLGRNCEQGPVRIRIGLLSLAQLILVRPRDLLDIGQGLNISQFDFGAVEFFAIERRVRVNMIDGAL